MATVVAPPPQMARAAMAPNRRRAGTATERTRTVDRTLVWACTVASSSSVRADRGTESDSSRSIRVNPGSWSTRLASRGAAMNMAAPRIAPPAAVTRVPSQTVPRRRSRSSWLR